MLDKLTPEQEQKMFEVRDFWNNYIDSCKNSVNKEQAVMGINWLYEGIKKKSPTIFFVASPMGCQLAVHYLKEVSRANVGANVWANVRDNVRANVRANVRDNVWDNVWDNVRDNVGDNVWANVRANVRDNVRANVGANVGANVRDNVGDNVRDNVWANVRDNVRANVGANVWANVGANVGANVRDNVWDNVRDNVGDNVRDNLEKFAYYGSISDYSWVSFFDFFTQIGVLNHDGFNQFKNLISSGIYDMIQMDGVCVVCDLPLKLMRNETTQLHCTTGYAIEFKDGYGQYYINGRVMPDWIFQDNTTEVYLNQFHKEENEDVKAGIITLIKENNGQEGLMKFLNAYLIDEKQIEHSNDYSETIRLYKTKESFPFLQDRNGNLGQPYCWSEITCPSTNSVYLIDNSADFNCALEAVKFLRPSFVPAELLYQWSEFAN